MSTLMLPPAPDTEPRRMMRQDTAKRQRRVAVFAGSTCGTNPAYLAGARALGREIAARQLELVYGGTIGGLMGAVAAAVRNAGGSVIGVVPARQWEAVQDPACTLVRVASLHQRVESLLALSDGVVVLPGGLGTLHEFFAVLAVIQAGERALPVGLLNVNDYFAPVFALVQRCQAQGFLPVAAEALRHLHCSPDPAQVLEAVLEEARGLQRLRQPLVAEEVP